ncbi:MAG: DUF642 domain-containing protein [Tepidisphaeraceae bacterium]|jgi:hypothetical protein
MIRRTIPPSFIFGELSAPPHTFESAVRWGDDVFLIKILIFAWVTWLLFPADGRAQNLLSNGGFESPGLPSSMDYQYLDTQPNLITGWTVTYDGIGEPSYYLRDGHSPGGGVIVYAAEGQYLLSLDNGDSLSTSFSSLAGQEYSLSFFVGGGADAVPAGSLQLNVGNLSNELLAGYGSITSIPADNVGHLYSLFQFDFVATSSTSNLTLTNPYDPNNWLYGNVQLDGFAVVAVPEPSGVLVLGISGMGFLARRRNFASESI